MWKPETPPSPPADVEKLLLELANYYQELVEYHQQAAQQAYVRLTQVEALMGEPKIMSVEAVNVEGQITAENSTLELRVGEPKDTSLKNSLSVEETNPWKEKKNWLESALSISKPKKTSSFTEAMPKNQERTEEIEKLLKQNRGKILHIDYLERELGEENLKKSLIEGEKEELWASVPDAPGCWTISLVDLPDFAVKSPKTPKKTVKKAKIMPQTGKMRHYQSLSNAVADCLEQSYPKVCTNQNVAEWLYPGGLSSRRLRKVREAIGKVLSKGEGDLWQRVSVGKYIWKAGANETSTRI